MTARRTAPRHGPTIAGLLAKFVGIPAGIADGEVPVYDEGSGLFIAGSPGGGGATTLGDLTDVDETSADAGEALVSDGDGTWSPSSAAVILEGDSRLTDPALYAAGHETFSREHISSLGLNHSSGNLRLTYWKARKSGSFTNMEIPTGTTPSSGTAPTLCQGAVFSVAGNGDLTRLATTTHDATLFATASADTVKSLDATVEIVEGQWYANATLVVTAGTAPTAQGQNPGSAGVSGRAPRLSGVITSQAAIESSYTAAQVADNANRVWTALLP